MLRPELKPIPRSWLGFRNVGVLSVIERRPFGTLAGDEIADLTAEIASVNDAPAAFERLQNASTM